MLHLIVNEEKSDHVLSTATHILRICLFASVVWRVEYWFDWLIGLYHTLTCRIHQPCLSPTFLSTTKPTGLHLLLLQFWEWRQYFLHFPHPVPSVYSCRTPKLFFAPVRPRRHFWNCRCHTKYIGWTLLFGYRTAFTWLAPVYSSSRLLRRCACRSSECPVFRLIYGRWRRGVSCVFLLLYQPRILNATW